jgi:hypothetical protein
MDNIVVAHYEETLDWLDCIDSTKYNIIIYNKSLNNIYNKGEILPNVGREAHTYLYHIIKSYDTMIPEKCTFFSQGCLEDHTISKSAQEYIDLSVISARTHGISQINCGIHDNVPIHTPTFYFRLLKYNNNSLVPTPNNETFGTWFERTIEQQFPLSPILWIRGANFAVKNSIILDKPKSYYQKLLKECDYSSSPETAHFFERAWQYVFKKDIRFIVDVPELSTDIKKSFANKILLCQIDTRSNIMKPWKDLIYPINDIICHNDIRPRFIEANPDFHANFNTVMIGHLYRSRKVTQYDCNKIPYWCLTSKLNKLRCTQANINYEYIQKEPIQDRAHAWIKTSTCRDILPYKPDDYDIIVVIDTDAWVVNTDALIEWCYFLHHSEQLIMFSGETTNKESFALLDIQQRVNTGCMIMKNTFELKPYFDAIYNIPDKVKSCEHFKSDWSWEQICTNYKLHNDKSFASHVVIAPLEKFNTPAGSIIRHCWIKDLVNPLVIQELLSEIH